MSLSIGIVGLPCVGKSTIFNLITNSSVEAGGYAFSTTEAHIGVVEIPDERLQVLSDISVSDKVVPATIEFVDIPSLVSGSSKGEGMGNKFLANIREVSALAHVVRFFEDDNVPHVIMGALNPLRDIDIVNTELLLADLTMAENIIVNQERRVKKDKSEAPKLELYKKIYNHLEQIQPLKTLKLDEDEKLLKKGVEFLTDKKIIYVVNISESMLGQEETSEEIKKIIDYAKEQNDEVIVISAKLEAELSKLEEDDRKEFMNELGIKEAGLPKFIKKSFSLLNLQTFLTTGKKETRAWTIKKNTSAQKAAGVIHSDLERGFIRANIVNYDDFVIYKSMPKAKEAAKLRQEGKEYIMQDGDIVEFLFNV